MTRLSRRQFLASTATAIVGAAAAARFTDPAIAAESEPTVLRIGSRVIEVNGKPANVFGLLQPDGTWGLYTRSGTRFRVRLESRIEEPTLIHWHGLLPPYGQDGVPDLPQPLLPPGQAYDYDFPLDTPGTHWMHAHTLQEQRQLAAPLIVADPADDSRDEQPVVVLLSDFSFKSPEELLAGLRGTSEAAGMAGHAGMAGMAGMAAEATSGMAVDTTDVDYDAFLANERTLADPEVFPVERGGIVRLRLINGGTATAFWIDLGTLDGTAVAVDGNAIQPVQGRRFPLGMGQRIDIRIQLPSEEGAWPILALPEGEAAESPSVALREGVEAAGFVLATKGGAVTRIGPQGHAATSPLDLVLEAGLRAARPLPEKPADRRETVVLGGDMAAYVWTLNGRTWGDHRPLPVRLGERVELVLDNQSMMGHPMHLHGHHFQVVAIDGQRLPGAVRDTVWVPPKRTLTIAFDAVNPGEWAFHCHHLYHMATGMMTTVAYEA